MKPTGLMQVDDKLRSSRSNPKLASSLWGLWLCKGGLKITITQKCCTNVTSVGYQQIYMYLQS